MSQPAPAGFEHRLTTQARAAGFDLAGIATLGAPDTIAHFDAWLANVKPADPAWDELMVCYGAAGFVEWTFDLGAAGEYYLHVYVTSGGQRPVALSINDQRLPGGYLDRNVRIWLNAAWRIATGSALAATLTGRS